MKQVTDDYVIAEELYKRLNETEKLLNEKYFFQIIYFFKKNYKNKNKIKKVESKSKNYTRF